MFGPKHYVPILKWKPAEQKALQELSAEEKKWITPLIQPVMPQPKAPKKGQQMKSREEQLEEVITDFKTKGSKIAEEIITAWGTLPIFVDLSLVYTPSLRVEVLTQILALGNEHGAFLIPVINLSSDAALIKSVSDLSKQHKHGLCLRLVRADLSDTEKLSQQIKDLLVTNGLSTENTDLLLDLNVTDEHDHEYHNLLNASQMIPHLTEWRTLTIACGAFPEDLTKCVLGENYIPRSDWKNWLEALQSIQLIRIPSFADYTIQHPIHKESSQFFLPSASIRYTLNDSWLVMRGQKGKSAQYLAAAQLLSQDTKFASVFRGAAFSYGDAYIAEKGKDIQSKKTGNATNWLTVGINHHLANTVDQIANLS